MRVCERCKTEIYVHRGTETCACYAAEVFERANEKFLREQKDLIKSDVSERCLCGRLMLYLSKEISGTALPEGYHVDVEYNRNKASTNTQKTRIKQTKSSGNGQVYCDLIVHSRGNIVEQDNILAIEMKKVPCPLQERVDDRERLIDFTQVRSDREELPGDVHGYYLGVCYEINIKGRFIEVEYYCKGRIYKVYAADF